MAEKEKKKKSKKGKTILIIILIACIGVAAFAAYNLITIGLAYKVGEDEYAELQQYTHEEQDDPQPDPEDIDDSGSEEESNEPKEKAPISVDIDELKAINSDFAAWLYIEAEDISYPVVHYEDNDFYLHRTFEKTDNFAGTLFIETQNNPDLSDPNTIIYGHNMRNRSMFGNLKFLAENEDYKKCDVFWLITDHGSYKYRIINMETVSQTSDVYTLFSGPSKEVVDYIKTRNAESVVSFDLGDVDEDSKIVTLSTCASNLEDRFVVQGILEGIY